MTTPTQQELGSCNCPNTIKSSANSSNDYQVWLSTGIGATDYWEIMPGWENTIPNLNTNAKMDAYSSGKTEVMSA